MWSILAWKNSLNESQQMMNGDKYSKDNQILATKGEQVKKNYVDQHDKNISIKRYVHC